MISSPRREQLADAALATIAREGSRGLTHRAVDRAAGMPEGTTSYYFRSRLSLLEAAVRRLAQLDAQMLGSLPAGSADELVDSFAQAIAGLEQQRWMHVARLELTLESTRHPELHVALSESASMIHRALTDRLHASGVADAGTRAAALLITVDGLLVDSLAGPEARMPGMEPARSLLQNALA
ncbi:MAG TPA: TetR family transcriptional regulator [Microbacterium sp.]|nr:TetR family transcriptional regulator [Microbacterium sp.]